MIWLPLSDAAAAGVSPASVAASRQLLLPSQRSWQMLLLSCFELSNAKVAMRSGFPPLASLLALLWSVWSISTGKNPSIFMVEIPQAGGRDEPRRVVNFAGFLIKHTKATSVRALIWLEQYLQLQSVAFPEFPTAVPRAHYPGEWTPLWANHRLPSATSNSCKNKHGLPKCN